MNITEIELELLQKSEYIEQCYVCGGYLLRKYTYAKRIACEPLILVEAHTVSEDNVKTDMKIEGGDSK
jgi:hypothetical protein